jgi:DNA repair protein RAD5
MKIIGVSPYNDIRWWQNNPTPQELEIWRENYLMMRAKSILSLPPLTHKVIEVQLTPEEFSFYDQIEQQATATYENIVANGSACKQSDYKSKVLIEWLLRLRQASTDPRLLLGRAATLSLSKKSMRKRVTRNCHSCNAKTNKFVDEDADADSKEDKDSPMTKMQIQVSDEDDDQDEMPKRKKIKHNEVEAIDLTTVVKTSKKIKRRPLQPLECGHFACDECLSFQDKCALCEIVKDVQINKDMKTSKTIALINELVRIRSINPKEKSVIFSEWSTYLDIIEDQLIKNGFDYVRLDGDVKKHEQKAEIVRMFQKDPDCKYPIMLATLKTGGVGLNLTAASNVFRPDSWYNPAVESQANDRLHRIGQMNPVVAYQIKSNTSIETVIDTIKSIKVEQANRVLNGISKRTNSTTTSGSSEEATPAVENLPHKKVDMKQLVDIFSNVIRQRKLKDSKSQPSGSIPIVQELKEKSDSTVESKPSARLKTSLKRKKIDKVNAILHTEVI